MFLIFHESKPLRSYTRGSCKKKSVFSLQNGIESVAAKIPRVENVHFFGKGKIAGTPKLAGNQVASKICSRFTLAGTGWKYCD